MRALYISVATAAVGGMLMGAAIRPKDSDLKEQRLAPQIIASNGWEGDTAPVEASYRRVGPVPEYVIGTDWSRPKTQEPQIAAVYELPEPESYSEPQVHVAPVSLAVAPPMTVQAMTVQAQPRLAPEPVSYPSITGDVIGRAPSAADNARDAVESFDDGGAERIEVIRVDHQGRGQIDNLAHGSDPHALIGEPAA